MEFNERFFDEILTSAGVVNLCQSKAEQALAVARSTAPVDTGDYRAGLCIKTRRAAHRIVVYVVGTDWKTLLVESKTSNLARALKAVR